MRWFLLYGLTGINLVINFWIINSTNVKHHDYAILGILLSFLSLGIITTNQISLKLAKSLIKNKKERVIFFFKPLLYISQISSIFLTLISGFSITFMSYFLPALFTGYYFPKLTFFIALGAIYASFKIISVILSNVPKPELNIIGIAIGRTEAPILWSNVDILSKSIQTIPPERIIFTIDNNFCVTEAKVNTQDNSYTGRTMILSLPLLKFLSKDQTIAIICHELAHFSAEDTKFSLKFFPIFHDTKKSINEINSAISNFGATSFTAIPAMALMSCFLETFSKIESEISRHCEKTADIKSSSLIGHKPMIEALGIIHFLSYSWNNCEEALFELLHQEGKIAKNIFSVFNNFVNINEAENIINNIINTHSPHPFNSHPSLKERYEYLGETPRVISYAKNWFTFESNLFISEIKDLEKFETILTEEKNKNIERLSNFVKIVEAQQENEKKAA